MVLKGRVASFVSKQKVARLATVDKSGNPHNVPICPALYKGKVYFATEGNSKKAANLKETGKAALIFDEYYENWARLKGVMIIGSTRIIDSGKEFEIIKKVLYRKFKQYPKQAPIEEGSIIVEIVPERIVKWGL